MRQASPPDSCLTLGSRRSRWRLTLWPERGGVWLNAEARDQRGEWQPVLHPTPPQVLAEDRRLHYANYALLPYSNRVGHGVIRARPACTSAPPLPVNWPGLAHPIHGLGWLQPWQVRGQSPREARLLLRWAGGAAWPWAFEAEQRLRLLGTDGLQLELKLRNLDHRAMPAGLGWHPCFARRSDLQLRLRVAMRQLMGPDELPCGEQVPMPALRAGQAAPAEALIGTDSAFAGWDGRARLDWPDLALDLRASGALARHVVLYAPASQDTLCLEPVSHLNNALGQWPRQAAQWGQRWLQPGGVLAGRVQLGLREAPKVLKNRHATPSRQLG